VLPTCGKRLNLDIWQVESNLLLIFTPKLYTIIDFVESVHGLRNNNYDEKYDATEAKRPQQAPPPLGWRVKPWTDDHENQQEYGQAKYFKPSIQEVVSHPVGI
jgi:hypothetical protein